MGELTRHAPVAICAAAAAGASLAAPAIPVAWLVATGLLGLLAAWAARSSPQRDSVGARVLAGIALVLVVASVVGLRALQDLSGLQRPLPERVSGVAELGSDPETSRFGTDVLLVAGGRRWAASFDRSTESVLDGLRSGDRLRIEGSPRPLRDAPEGWLRSRHLAGRLSVGSAEPAGGTLPWFAVANHVHELLERGSASMDPEHRSLYLGLVVGDDRGQSEMTRFRFRASGLTHLLAVSGQNLVFVLAVVAPLGRRLPWRARWALAVGAVAGFVLVTRAEPSVLRAATMAGLALTAGLTGRRVAGVRTLALAVAGLLVCDPMLVHSVGFRLSVAATAGLVLLTPWIRERLVGPDWLRLPLAVTLAAQAGAVPVLTATFGPASLVSVPANLLAEPAAGAVMTLGMSSGLLAGIVREELAWLLQVPVRAGVWWVDRVATAASQLGVPPLGAAGWLCVLAGVAGGIRLQRGAVRPAPGRALVVALLPAVVLLRPTAVPGAGEPAARVPVDAGAAVLDPVCDRWVLEVGAVPGVGERAGAAGELDEAGAARMVEDLWSMGITRVGLVSVRRELTVEGESGSPDPVIEVLATQLRAEVVMRPPTAAGEAAVRSECPATT